jgi:hypothetical protein
MSVHRWLKLGFDTVNLMGSVAEFVEEARRQSERKTPREAPALPYQDEPVMLHDIGLDDVEFGIYIELSQNRTNFKIWAPYNEEFRVALKSEVPRSERRWDSTERCWRVGKLWIASVHDLLLEHYPGTEIRFTDRAINIIREMMLEQQAPPPPPSSPTPPKRKTTRSSSHRSHGHDFSPPPPPSYPSTPSPYAVLGVIENAPDEVVKAAYKAQARRYHADLGGDDQRMKQVNAAYEEIRRARAWTS